MTNGMPPLANLHATMQAKASKSNSVLDSVPRSARVHVSVKVQGAGETRLAGTQAIKFGAFMTEEPSFTFGVVSGGGLGFGELPVATAVVLNWVKGENGFYTGAEMGFRVESTNSRITLYFTLSFEGVTMRATTGHDGKLGTPTSSPNLFTGQ